MFHGLCACRALKRTQDDFGPDLHAQYPVQTVIICLAEDATHLSSAGTFIDDVGAAHGVIQEDAFLGIVCSVVGHCC